MANKRKSFGMCMDIEFPYTDEESDIFEKVKRPRIKIKVFSDITKNWEVLDEVLADTGADFCVFPRFIGSLLTEDITKGKYVEIKGVVPGVKLIAYIHNLKIRVADKEFVAPVAIADSDDVPMIFGRVEGLDLFDADFFEGKRLTLSYE